MSVLGLIKKTRKMVLSAAIGASALSSTAATFAVDTVDVMVLYNTMAENYNSRGINTYINHLISSSNTAYQKSDMNVRIRLVHSEKIEARGVGKVNGASLEALSDNAKIKEMRAKYGADLVVMLSVGERTNRGTLCGIAYVGRGSRGKIYPSFIRYGAYSVTGIDCGASTFTHELGHNMGLHHSRKQDKKGGMFDYALGHGVENRFGTIMTYPYLYNARGVELFSNPRIKECYNMPCGVAGEYGGADAARSVNQVSAQIADFYPTQVGGTPTTIPTPSPTPGSTPTSTPVPTPTPVPTLTPIATPTPTPIDPTREVPVIDGNIVTNASFESGSEPWFGIYNGSLSLDSNARFTGKSSVRVSDRRRYSAGAAYPLKSKLKVGNKYTIDAFMKLDGKGSQPGRMAIAIIGDKGVRHIYADRIGISGDKWTKISHEFIYQPSSRVGNVSNVYVFFYGPERNKDFFLDQVSIVAEKKDGGTVPPTTGTNLMDNGGLELGKTVSWIPNNYSKIFTSSSFSYEGKYSLVSYNRYRQTDGPVQFITSKVTAGNNYRFSAWVRMYTDRSKIKAGVYYRDDAGGHWISLDNQYAGEDWVQLGGIFSLDVIGELREARLHFFGPQPDYAFFIDDVVLEEL